MTILWRTSRDPNFVGLTALVITDAQTKRKQISISEGGGPCSIPGEQWLPVFAYGSSKTDVYRFNDEEIKGKENVIARMKDYVLKNYSSLLVE